MGAAVAHVRGHAPGDGVIRIGVKPSASQIRSTPGTVPAPCRMRLYTGMAGYHGPAICRLAVAHACEAVLTWSGALPSLAPERAGGEA